MARGLEHAAAHTRETYGARPGHGGRSPAMNVDGSTTASSPPSGAHGVDTPDSPRPFRDPWAPRPAGSSVLGYYLNGDNGDFNEERTASNVAVAPSVGARSASPGEPATEEDVAETSRRPR